MTKVLTPLAALAFTFGAQAAIVPAETFDTYTAGTTVSTNQTGWSFTAGNDGADDASIITAYDNNAPASNIVPDGQSAGANYLKLSTEDGTLFRNLDTEGGTLDLNAGLFVDTDVQFTVTDPSDSPTNTVSADDKLVIWLEATDTTTNLCVLGHSFGASTSDRTDKVYTLVTAGGQAPSIVPGAWYRLTVKAVSDFSLAGESVSYPAFQVYLDGAALKADETIGNASTLGISQISDYKPYIPARTASMTSLTKVGFSGEGALDSVVVTKDVPAFESPTTLTFTWDSSVISTVDLDELGVSLSSSGSSVSVYPNQIVTLTLNGYNSATHELRIESSADGYATVAGQVVTAVSAGAATIAITTTAKDTVDVTFNWADLRTAFEDSTDANITSIQFAYGEVVESAVLGERRAAHTITGLKVGTNITVTVTLDSSISSDWTTTITPASCMTKSGNVLTIASRPESGTAEVAISAVGAVVKIGDTPYASLQEAVDAATSGATLTLAQNITLTEAVTVAAGKTLTVDLNGKTITGAADVAVFSNAGALTITDSSTNHDGAVTAGSNGVVVANTGTLDLVYGAYTGTFTGTIDSITADCSFSYDISAGESPVYAIASGYEMAVSAGRYSLAAIEYDITFNGNGSDGGTAMSTEHYTVAAAHTLAANTYTKTGYTFDGWATAADGAVVYADEGTIPLGTTGNIALYAKWTANAPSTPTITPTNSTETAASYTSAEADDIVTAINAAKSTYIAAPEGITGTAAEDYSAKFTASKVLDEGSGNYKVVVGLTSAATTALTTDAGDQAATLAGQLSTVAATASATSVALTGAEPGFYYSVGYATTVGGEYTEGDRAMAASDGTVTLPIPEKSSGATAGFYKVFVNVADK